jgi:gas vesicle protein
MTHQEKQGNFGAFVLGLLVGASIGAAAALLNAPRSGEETRKQLQRAADELRKEADSVVSTAKVHVQEAKDELARHATEIRAETEAAVQETKKVLAEGAKDVKQEAAEGAGEVRQAAKSG